MPVGRGVGDGVVEVLGGPRVLGRQEVDPDCRLVVTDMDL